MGDRSRDRIGETSEYSPPDTSWAEWCAEEAQIYITGVCGPKVLDAVVTAAVAEVERLCGGGAGPPAPDTLEEIRATVRDAALGEAQRSARKLGARLAASARGNFGCATVPWLLHRRVEGLLSASEVVALYHRLDRCAACAELTGRFDAAEWHLQQALARPAQNAADAQPEDLADAPPPAADLEPGLEPDVAASALLDAEDRGDRDAASASAYAATDAEIPAPMRGRRRPTFDDDPTGAAPPQLARVSPGPREPSEHAPPADSGPTRHPAAPSRRDAPRAPGGNGDGPAQEARRRVQAPEPAAASSNVGRPPRADAARPHPGAPPAAIAPARNGQPPTPRAPDAWASKADRARPVRRAGRRARVAALAALLVAVGVAAVLLTGVVAPRPARSPVISPASRQPLASLPVSPHDASPTAAALPGVRAAGLVLGSDLPPATGLAGPRPQTPAALARKVIVGRSG